MKTYQRTLLDKEKRRLQRSLPWFGKARRDGIADIEQGFVNVHEFEIKRIWDINGCRPPCCPYTILFETAEDSFVYLESWNEIEREETVEDASHLTIESTPKTQRLLKSKIEGRGLIKRNDELRELNEFFEVVGDAEWRIWKKAEMPEEVLTMLERV